MEKVDGTKSAEMTFFCRIFLRKRWGRTEIEWRMTWSVIAYVSPRGFDTHHAHLLCAAHPPAMKSQRNRSPSFNGSNKRNATERPTIPANGAAVADRWPSTDLQLSRAQRSDRELDTQVCSILYTDMSVYGSATICQLLYVRIT